MTAAVPLGYARTVEYPETDGKPVAETDLHIEELIDARETLKRRFQDDPKAYVAGNLLIYYEEGNLAARFAPDVFVVFGVPKRRRRVFKLWEEKRAPAFVLDVTSRGTRIEDKGNKRELCAELGVLEYFLFDPEADYLKPPLQGFRLKGGRYEPILPDAKGMLSSEALRLRLTLDEEGLLRFIVPATGERLLRIAEQADRAEQADQAEREAAQAKQQAAQAKQQATVADQRADQAERRAAAAEAELERLRALLDRK